MAVHQLPSSSDILNIPWHVNFSYFREKSLLSSFWGLFKEVHSGPRTDVDLSAT